MEEFDFTGFWWLPEKPDASVVGILRFKPTGHGELELPRTFSHLSDGDFNLKTFPIILGASNTGKFITLVGCIEESRHHTGLSENKRSILRSVFRVKLIVKGGNWVKQEDLMIEQFRSYYAYLNEWMRTSRKQWMPMWEVEKHDFKVEPQPVEVEVPINTDVTIALKHSFTMIPSGERVVFEHESFVEVKYASPIKIEDLTSGILHHMQIFLSLGMGKATFPLSLYVKVLGSPEWVEVFFTMDPDVILQYSIHSSSEMLFTLEDIHKKASECLINWFSKLDKLEPIYNLYGAVLSKPGLYIELSFLALAQAVEAYHRRLYDRTYIDEESFDKVIEVLEASLPNDIDKKLKESILSSLMYSNRPNLANRLMWFWKYHRNVIKCVIRNRKDFESFAYWVKESRNALTHYNPDKKRPMGQDLFDLASRLRFLLEISFMHELGIEEPQIIEIVKRHQRYKSI